MDPKDPGTLYAAMWQRVRRKWSDPRVEPNYQEGGIWKTTDAGATWAPANTGLPRSPAAAPQVAARRDWKEAVNKETALHRSLELVIRAIEP